jgi:hypothetical protein
MEGLDLRKVDSEDVNRIELVHDRDNCGGGGLYEVLNLRV